MGYFGIATMSSAVNGIWFYGFVHSIQQLSLIQTLLLRDITGGNGTFQSLMLISKMTDLIIPDLGPCKNQIPPRPQKTITKITLLYNFYNLFSYRCARQGWFVTWGRPFLPGLWGVTDGMKLCLEVTESSEALGSSLLGLLIVFN